MKKIPSTWQEREAKPGPVDYDTLYESLRKNIRQSMKTFFSRPEVSETESANNVLNYTDPVFKAAVAYLNLSLLEHSGAVKFRPINPKTLDRGDGYHLLINAACDMNGENREAAIAETLKLAPYKAKGDALWDMSCKINHAIHTLPRERQREIYKNTHMPYELAWEMAKELNEMARKTVSSPSIPAGLAKTS